MESLESRPTQQRAALYRIAMFACRRHFTHWAFGNCTRSGAEVTSIPERIELHTEDGSRRKTGDRDALSRNGRGAGHFDAPGDWFSIAIAHRLPLRAERHKVDFGMVGLGDKSRHDPSQGDGLRLVIHRK